VLIDVVLAVLCASLSSNAGADELPSFSEIVSGQCDPISHIAEGASGEDLSKHESRVFCDVAVVGVFKDDPKHVLVRFVDSKSDAVIVYAGMMKDAEHMSVRSVDIESKESHQPIPVEEGDCRFFFNKRFLNEKRISGIACGAKVVKSGRRTVPIVAFDADPTSKSTWPHELSLVSYNRKGVVNCSLPGTTIEFALDGRGGARVVHIESDYAPFLTAAQHAPVWRAVLSVEHGDQMLGLRDGHSINIIVRLPDGKGSVFASAADGGIADIRCQVFVRP
jgi:hypothetical protein